MVMFESVVFGVVAPDYICFKETIINIIYITMDYRITSVLKVSLIATNPHF